MKYYLDSQSASRSSLRLVVLSLKIVTNSVVCLFNSTKFLIYEQKKI